MREIFLAGGCFWGLEKYLSSICGVHATTVGYANGHTESPTYEQVCSHTTGHAETVRVLYDPSQLPLEKLLRLYLKAIDPFSVNKQGSDVGPQYRTGIYFSDPSDKPPIEKILLEATAHYSKPLATELVPLSCFYPAEDYHQKYLFKNPNGYCHISDALCHAAAEE